MIMFRNPFSTEGRIARLEYFLSFLIFVASDVVCNILFGKPSDNVIYAIVILIVFVFFVIQGAKRCHDINKSGCWQLIPFFFIWLLIAKGDKGENYYGENPNDIN